MTETSFNDRIREAWATEENIMFAIFSLIIAAASAFGALATNIWVRSQIRELGTKTSPDAGTSGEVAIELPDCSTFSSDQIDRVIRHLQGQRRGSPGAR